MITPNPTNDIVHDGKLYDTFTEPPKLMAQERAQLDFDPRDITYFLDGSKEETELLESLMLTYERDPLFNNQNEYDESFETLRERSVKRIFQLSKSIAMDPEPMSFRKIGFLGILDMGTYARLGVHYALFCNSIRGQGTPDQLMYWLDQGAMVIKGFYGCFAMTELGHGSNLSRLETIATFDKETDEFIINTPHVGATKWWIGGAAHTSTHTLAFARLQVDGKDYGVKSFVVPLRNLDDHSLRPGIATGDIGKKMGRDAVDNGWIQFTNVRVPRNYMLMKHTKVLRDGTVKQPPLAQLTYGSLITGRVQMTTDSHNVSKKFLTIALRYATIRRQFSSTPGEPETRLIDYLYHQRRLLPLMAYSYAMKLAGDHVRELFFASQEKAETLKEDDKAGVEAYVQDIKELFSVSAGLKAATTWACADIIDKARQACGGHGYSAYNGFGQAFQDWVVQCTWEGDNTVLTLSAGRALIQSALVFRKEGKLGNATKYLSRSKELAKAKRNGRSLEDPKLLVEAWEAVSAGAINAATDAYEELAKQGVSVDECFEQVSQERFQAARIHTRRALIEAFYSRIATAEDKVKPHLIPLANLFALWSIEEDSALFLAEGYFEPEDIIEVTSLVNKYCGIVRKNVIGYTDAFNLSDYFINAAIGRYDGDVYKNYFEKVKQQYPPEGGKPHYYETVMKPFMHRERIDDVPMEPEDIQ
ncbi:Acyl-coenzyme A oxidase 2 [Yarrowia sp. C11]|nr:Acyl-coenzyme A oxidase 2 [Yarrowia sp. C11]KAG5370933.1 Acyl-coenzyme A oxidase 2 [Yarrowia sp. E02]